MTTELVESIQLGRIIERDDSVDAEYGSLLKEHLLVMSDSELMSAYAMAPALADAPTLQAQMTGLAIIQDEINHGAIGYRLLAGLGEEPRALLYRRPAVQFRSHYFFGFRLERWVEFIACNILSDRAGHVALKWIQRNSSYGPWRRALATVNVEERFHVRHGEHWVKVFRQDPARFAELQKAVDWVFPAAAEYFWAPPAIETDLRASNYRLFAPLSELLQQWLAQVVPFCAAHGLKIPARFDDARQRYVLDYSSPLRFDAEGRRWLFGESASPGEMLARRHQGGPAKQAFVRALRGAYVELARIKEGQ